MSDEKRHRDEIDFREIIRDPRKLFAYVYANEINLPKGVYVPVRFDDRALPSSGVCYLKVPADMAPGTYRIEYWNTFTGKVVGTRFCKVGPGRRVLPLPEHRVDLAVKAVRRQVAGRPARGGDAMGPVARNAKGP